MSRCTKITMARVAPLTVVKHDALGRIVSVQPVRPVHVPGLLEWTIRADNLGGM